MELHDDQRTDLGVARDVAFVVSFTEESTGRSASGAARDPDKANPRVVLPDSAVTHCLSDEDPYIEWPGPGTGDDAPPAWPGPGIGDSLNGTPSLDALFPDEWIGDGTGDDIVYAPYRGAPVDVRSSTGEVIGGLEGVTLKLSPEGSERVRVDAAEVDSESGVTVHDIGDDTISLRSAGRS